MLEVIDLKKEYKVKGGVITKALDGVSLKFPETGMIFLLGKSGSGKSTLLNVIGGLDRPDSGEIIIKGKNSKDFSGADFDSYRNTYIGFIFQEYNILNEFNIEQNISLALQLQGKKNDKATVDALLEQVDLKGFNKRKPNTLSGGQKQRVAIARALIKNPEIIMADEPTGALDSNTGKQVFDTLKKLSEKKLVIVVSHDRDFAEIYADRIIELSDGKVISDMSKEYVKSKPANENINIVNDNTVAIKDTSKLTESDMITILNALKATEGEAIISKGEHDVSLVRQAIHVNKDNSSEVFNDTKDVAVKEYNPKDTKFIRSRLPFSRAFKMGASSLKLKPIRLIFTILLTTIALTMFGLVSTLMMFRESYSVQRAMENSPATSEAISKHYLATTTSYDLDLETGKVGSYDYESEIETLFGQEEINKLNDNHIGLKFAGVFNNSNSSPRINLPASGIFSQAYQKADEVFGFIDAGKDYITGNGFEFVAGSYPVNDDEVAITTYQYGYLSHCFEGIESYENLINKVIPVEFYTYSYNVKYNLKITGIIDTKIPSIFDDYIKGNEMSEKEKLETKKEFESLINHSYHNCLYVNSNFYNIHKEDYDTNNRYINQFPGAGLVVSTDKSIENQQISGDSYNSYYTDTIYSGNTDLFSFINLKGETIQYKQPEMNEAYIPNYIYSNLNENARRSYFAKANDFIYGNWANYNSTLYTLLSNEENKTKYTRAYERLQNYDNNYSTYPSEYDVVADRKLISDLIEDYYLECHRLNFIYNKAERYSLVRNYSSIPSDSEYEQFEIYRNEITSTTPYTLTHIDDIKNYLETRTDGLLDMYDYVSYASNIWIENSDIQNRKQELIDKYNNSYTLSNDEYEELKEIVNKYYNPNIYGGEEMAIGMDYKVPNLSKEPKLDKIYYKNYNGEFGSLNVIGVVKCKSGDNYLLNEQFIRAKAIMKNKYYYSITTTKYVTPSDAKYNYIITNTTFSQSQIDVFLFTSKEGAYRYSMTNDRYINLLVILNMISTLKKVFLIVGLVCGVFAALLLLNFIATSISSKIKEIGILRAVGARGGDLFKIFFSESGLISIICIVLSIVASILTCFFLNKMMIEEVGIALLNFNIINIGFIIVGSLLIAVMGTFFPVLSAAKKPPVESIRTL